MTQGELEKIPKGIEKAFSELEVRIMQDIVRRIQANGASTASADWQTTRLQQLGMSEKQIKEWIRDLLEVTDEEVDRIYSDEAYEEYTGARRAYEVFGRRQLEYGENRELQQVVEAVREQTKELLQNLTATMGFVKARPDGRRQSVPLTDFYRQTLDAAVYDIRSGAFDYNTVLKRSITDMTKSGLQWIDYKSGWHNRVPVAARRAVMTGFRQVQGKINEQVARDLGTNSYEVTVHIGARPTHQVWEGRVWTWEQLCSTEEGMPGLGSALGLHGINCYHDYNPFIPGVSVRTYTDEELDRIHEEENTPKEYGGRQYTTYEALQHQRKLETRARMYREDVALMEECGADEDTITTTKARYQKTMQEYRAFSRKMGLPVQRERIYQDGLKVDISVMKKKIANEAQSDTIEKKDLQKSGIIISSIDSRNTASGKPSAIVHFDVPLNKRQKRLLDSFPQGYDEITVGRKTVSMKDLSALTAKTGLEYAMFTRRGERLIIRGTERSVNITYERAIELKNAGYKWSGHTHPGSDDYVLFPSEGDIDTLKFFDQDTSVIDNSSGKFYVFDRGGLP